MFGNVDLDAVTARVREARRASVGDDQDDNASNGEGDEVVMTVDGGEEEEFTLDLEENPPLDTHERLSVDEDDSHSAAEMAEEVEVDEFGGRTASL